MSAAIGPGDWVECIEAVNPEYIGRVFLVGEVFPNMTPCFCGKPGAVTIVGRLNSAGGPYVCTFTLRPIYRPRADIIERLLEPIRESEDA